MANDLIINEVPFRVKFELGKIEIENEEALNLMVKAIVDKYNALVFNDENVEAAKTTRAELNNHIKQLSEELKKVKNQYLEPFSNFQGKITQLQDDLKQVSLKIDASVKEFEEKERAQRFKTLKSEMQNIADNYEIPVEALKVEKSWTNKGAFTTKGNLTKKISDEIINAVMEIKQQEELNKKKEIQMVQDTAMVKKLAEVMELESSGWVALLNEGKSTAEILSLMEIASKQQKEQQKKEISENVEQFEKEVIETKIEKPLINDVEPVEEELYSFTLKITGTKEQLKVAKNAIVASGAQHESVE